MIMTQRYRYVIHKALIPNDFEAGSGDEVGSITQNGAVTHKLVNHGEGLYRNDRMLEIPVISAYVVDEKGEVK